MKEQTKRRLALLGISESECESAKVSDKERIADLEEALMILSDFMLMKEDE